VLGVVAVLAVAVLVLNWTWGRLPGEPKPTGSFVQVGKVRLRVLERPGSGPPVVLIHGLPGTADDFDAVTPLLAGHRTLAYDRPGFGSSTGDYHPMSVQLATLRALVQRLGGAPAVLVGHSYGGTIALAFAERYPRLVRGLVLVDAAAGGTSTSGFDRAQARFVQVLGWPVVQPLATVTFSQAVRTASAKQGDARAFDPNPVNHAHEQRLLSVNMRPEDLDAYAGEELAASDVFDGVDARLAAITTPAVVIQGASDRLVKPRYGRRLAATLPHARLVLPSGGHMQPYVHPGAVAAAVRSLLPAGR
jgi:pimeloyl-ACP methyl ester carboxylesterase